MIHYKVFITGSTGEKEVLFKRVSKQKFEDWAREYCSYAGSCWVLLGTSCIITCKVIE